ncbi:MAG: hypothetical protein NZ932_06670 [Candidatus Bathyarchaeota archaeon]|nr:hypothetical protein [Candidatus Bathyarchaeota archaeon]MDW8040311.1 hypothetical protein [Nitrososphaerota archaeon]
MNRKLALFVCSLFFACTLINGVYAEEDSFLNQFLGSPLLALTATIIVVAVAFLYRKLRK